MKNPYEIDKKGDIWCSNYPNVFNGQNYQKNSNCNISLKCKNAKSCYFCLLLQHKLQQSLYPKYCLLKDNVYDKPKSTLEPCYQWNYK